MSMARVGRGDFGERVVQRLPGVFSVIFLVGLVVAALVVVLPPWPPLQDYLEWAYQGVVVDRMLADGWQGTPFAFRDYPVPNSVSQAMIALLAGLVGPAMAAKLVLLVYLALLLLVWRALRKLGPAATANPAMVILFSVMAGSQFLNGYSNNLFGNLLLVLYGANILRRKPLILETLLFSVLIFFSHATSYTVFGLLVVIHVFWRAFRWQHLLALVPTGVMFLWYTAAKDSYVDEGLNLSGIRDWIEYKAYTLAKLGPYHNFFISEVDDSDRAPVWFGFGLMLNAAFLVFVLFLVFQVFIRNRLHWLKDPAWVSVAVLLAAYPLMPNTVSGVVNIGERYVTIAFLLLVPIAVMGPLRWTLAWGGALSAFIIPVHLWLVTLTTRPEVWQRQDTVSYIVPDERSERLRRLFWHRPLHYFDRVGDIARVTERGLQGAPPLDFTTSFIGAAGSEDVAVPVPE